MAREQFYWDSNAFSGHLNDEGDKVAECEAVLSEAEKGHILLVTSALTIAEVLFIRPGGPRLPPEKREDVEKFFKADYITVRNVTRAIAELARDVFWDHGIRPKDAVHVATASLFKVPVLHTFDGDLLGRNGIVINGHTLRIERPHVPHQLNLIDDNIQEQNGNETEPEN